MTTGLLAHESPWVTDLVSRPDGVYTGYEYNYLLFQADAVDNSLIGGPYVFTLCFLAQCQLAILEYYCGRVALNLGPCLSLLQKEQSRRVMVPGW